MKGSCRKAFVRARANLHILKTINIFNLLMESGPTAES